MPPVNPTPIVPANPTGGTQYAGGGSSASGMVPVSGTLTLTDYSGAHFIETQSMYINYVRVPWFFWSATSWALSGQLDTTFGISRTTLCSEITCTVTKQKSYDIYATSGWTQPQTFAVNAVSGDTYGSIYGTAAEFGEAYVLGVGGSIVTEQEYYNRRPWQDGVDVESTSSVTAYNTIMGRREMQWVDNSLTVVSSTIEATTEWGVYENGILGIGSKFDPNQWMYDPFRVLLGWHYNLYGEYRYNQESFSQLLTYVDQQCGENMRNSYHYDLIPTQNQWHQHNRIGLPTYDPTRHNWTTFS